MASKPDFTAGNKTGTDCAFDKHILEWKPKQITFENANFNISSNGDKTEVIKYLILHKFISLRIFVNMGPRLDHQHISIVDVYLVRT